MDRFRLSSNLDPGETQGALVDKLQVSGRNRVVLES